MKKNSSLFILFEIHIFCSVSCTGESTSLEENPISAGAPSFVVQEEFDRYTGYWWQPVLDNTSASQ